jgi:hypothetical protein
MRRDVRTRRDRQGWRNRRKQARFLKKSVESVGSYLLKGLFSWDGCERDWTGMRRFNPYLAYKGFNPLQSSQFQWDWEYPIGRNWNSAGSHPPTLDTRQATSCNILILQRMITHNVWQNTIGKIQVYFLPTNCKFTEFPMGSNVTMLQVTAKKNVKRIVFDQRMLSWYTLYGTSFCQLFNPSSSKQMVIIYLQRVLRIQKLAS